MEKIWLKSYPPGTPAEIDVNLYPSIPAIINESYERYPEYPAFSNMGVTLTYQQLKAYAHAFGAFLQHQLHFKKGDRLALMMPNILQYPVALFGALHAGATIVNVNPLYTVPELVHQLNDAEVETIVVLANFANTVEKALPQTKLKNIIITEIGDLFPRFKAWLIHIVLKYFQRKLPKVCMPQPIFFKEAIALGKTLSLKEEPLSHEDIAFLQYTGGTTGVAKGAMLSHKNMVANILQAEAWFRHAFKEEKEIMVTALPLYHIFSLTANCLFISKIGGLNILITNPRNIPGLVKEISKFKFSVITGVNTLFHALLNNPEFKKLDFSALKICLGGGMAVQRTVAEQWQKVTKKPILEAYGLTETAPCVTINPPNLKAYNGTVGLPVSSTNIAIFNDEYQALACNEPGELAIKGPQVMMGYWKNPLETSKVFTKDGWLLTGDIALLDDKGFVRILERKKDMILVSGFNVYPNEIEDTLMRMPGILEVAVIGVPDVNSGEVPKAFIVKRNSDLTAEQVMIFCRENLTGYKIPRHIEFCQTLPKTNVGKISRRALRNQIHPT